MRDQRGMTLTELMAGMAITMIVLVAAFSVYYAIHNATAGGVERYMDKSAMDAAMQRLTAEIADATAVYVSGAGDELRYVNGFALKAIVFDAADRTLTLYDFSADAPPADKLANLTDASVSLASRPELYTNPRGLPGAVTEIRVADKHGAPIAGTAVGGGSVVRLAVTFATENGSRAVETAVKLFHDAA